NARDLRTLEVHPGAFARIAPLAREIAPLVAESGVRTPEDARRLRALGASMLLVGEALSSAAAPQSATRALVQARRCSSAACAPWALRSSGRTKESTRSG